MMADSFPVTGLECRAAPDFVETRSMTEQALLSNEVYISWRCSCVGSLGNGDEKYVNGRTDDISLNCGKEDTYLYYTRLGGTYEAISQYVPFDAVLDAATH